MWFTVTVKVTLYLEFGISSAAIQITGSDTSLCPPLKHHSNVHWSIRLTKPECDATKLKWTRFFYSLHEQLLAHISLVMPKLTTVWFLKRELRGHRKLRSVTKLCYVCALILCHRASSLQGPCSSPKGIRDQMDVCVLFDNTPFPRWYNRCGKLTITTTGTGALYIRYALTGLHRYILCNQFFNTQHSFSGVLTLKQYERFT